MPTTPALARPAPRTPAREHDLVSLFVVLMMAAAMIVAVSALLVDPPRIDLELHNPTDHEITVHVRDGPDGSRLQLGSWAPGTARTVTGVLDRGDRWVFEFSSAGVDAGTVELESAAVRRSVVTVPDDVGEDLREAGVVPSPR